MEERVVRKQCAGCGNEIVSDLEANTTLDWYVLVADSYCSECIEEEPLNVLMKKEVVKIARE